MVDLTMMTMLNKLHVCSESESRYGYLREQRPRYITLPCVTDEENVMPKYLEDLTHKIQFFKHDPASQD